MSSANPSTRKRIDRGVRNFDSAGWDRKKQKAVSSETYVKLAQYLAMKTTFSALAASFWLKPALRTQCGALASGRMISGSTTHASGERKKISVRHCLPFAKQFAKVRPGRHTQPLLVGSARDRECRNSLNFVSAAVGPVNRGQRWPRSFVGVLTFFSDTPADQSREGLEIASGVGSGLALSEHGPCFVGGNVTLDDISFTRNT